MPLKSMALYSCAVCGNTLCGMEWEDHTNKSNSGKDFVCPECGHALNEDELYSEDD